MRKRILVSACLLGVCCRYDGRGNPSAQVLDLLKRDDLELIPVCPEQLGGLPTPRLPSERVEDRIINRAGEDVTDQFQRGAAEALRLARSYGCDVAVLKERSPSCGCGEIYDGTFTGTLVAGNGVTAELLLEHGIPVYGESRISELLR